MSKVLLGVAGVLVSLVTGCATVDVRPVRDAEQQAGVRFYRPWPYLLVTSSLVDEKPVTKWQVIYLPDVSREYAAKVSPGWGTANATIKLQDGWNLIELGAAIDSKGPETITAASGLLTAAASLRTTEVPGFVLYRLEEENGRFTGLRQVDLVNPNTP